MSKEQERIGAHEFYFETSLYEKVKMKDVDWDIFNGEVDAYSYKNEIETTYSINQDVSSCFKYDISSGTLLSESSYDYSCYNFDGFIEVKLTCRRKENDIIIFNLLVAEDYVMKVGQYPSLADIQFAELGKKYDKVLDKEDLKNYKKAIGLFSHGSGAGSFVYLRRIFENLIMNTFSNNKDNIGVSLEDFKVLHMSEKINTIKDFLPKQMYGFMEIYKILSVGVHKLKEEECLKYFKVLKISIDLMLEEKIRINEEEEKSKRVAQELTNISQEILESEEKK